MQFALAKVIGGNRILLDNSKAFKTRCKAAVPLDTTEAYLEPKNLANLCSKLSTEGPWVNQSPLVLLLQNLYLIHQLSASHMISSL